MSKKLMLSQSDVAKLLKEPSADTRAETVRKVGDYVASSSPSETEKLLAQDIFRALVKDAEVRVRKALADTLKESPELPSDVAKILVDDVDEVALPIIEFSTVLEEDDLISIVESQNEKRQMAVAKRAEISSDVSDLLADVGGEDVVSTLVGNDGAQIKEATFDRVLNKYAGSDAVKAPMAHRKVLPLAVAERLVSMVSESIRDHLVTHHELSPAVAADLLLETRERATVSLLTPGSKTPDVLELVDQLSKNGRLTPTLVIRALCMGDLTFFEAALARLADIPVSNAFQLVHDRGQLGLEKLFQRASMPMALLKLARTAVLISKELQLTSGDDRDLFRKVVIERVLTQIDEDLDSEDLDYLIGKLGRKAA